MPPLGPAIPVIETLILAFDLEQDSIIIFPSKTPHATAPNNSGQTRISISGDVTIMLRDSKGFEHLMPNFKNWTKF